MELDDAIEQLRGAIPFVKACRDTKYSVQERHGFLTFALMHICQASIYGDAEPHRYGFALHDYKHIVIKAIEAVMNGKPIDDVMKDVPDFPLESRINWNYTSNRDSFR